MHKSCPAGFEAVKGIIQGRFVCRCNRADLNIRSCNRTTEDVLLKVRESEVELCAWRLLAVHHTTPAEIFTVYVFSSLQLLALIFLPHSTASTTCLHPHPPSFHAGQAMGHAHHQLRRCPDPVYYRLFPWLLPLPAVVHRQQDRVQVHCVSGPDPEGPTVHLQQTRLRCELKFLSF